MMILEFDLNLIILYFCKVRTVMEKLKRGTFFLIQYEPNKKSQLTSNCYGIHNKTKVPTKFTLQVFVRGIH